MLGSSGKSFATIESTLDSDLQNVSQYFHRWHLKLSESKTLLRVPSS